MRSFAIISSLLAMLGVVAGSGVNLYSNPYTAKSFNPKKVKSMNAGVSAGAAWTYYSAYPACCEGAPNYDPNADKTECQQYNRCADPGVFAGIGRRDITYVEQYPLISLYDNKDPKNEQWYENYGNKWVSISGTCKGQTKSFSALVADTCVNADCDNCCTKNADPKTGYLISLERNTLMRFFGSEDCADGKAKLFFSIAQQDLAVENCGDEFGTCNLPQHCCGADNKCRQTDEHCFAQCRPEFGYCGSNNGTCGPVARGQTCGEDACCGKDGYCGTGAVYCGDGCEEGFGAACDEPDDDTPSTQSNGEARAFQFLPIHAGIFFILATMFVF